MIPIFSTKKLIRSILINEQFPWAPWFLHPCHTHVHSHRLSCIG